MKKNSLLVVLLCMFVLGSCQKDEITVTVKESGTVSVKVVDENLQPVAGGKVHVLYQSSGFLNFDLSGDTDENGVFTTESLLPGLYLCHTQITKGKLVYKAEKIIQIISGENRVVTLSPMENVGNLTIQLVNPYADHPEPVSGINVALVPSNTVGYPIEGLTVAGLEPRAIFTAVSDADGKVRFEKVPADDYYVMTYDPVLDKVYFDSYIAIGIVPGQDETYLLNCYFIQP